MNGRTTFRLFIAVFLLGSFIFFYERHRASSDEERAQMRVAFDVDAASVTGLRVRTADYDVSVVLQDGEWRMTTPSGARAHAAIIKQVLSRLVSMNRGALITPEEMRERQQTLADFGLTVPSAQIELQMLQGNRGYHVGNPNPLGDSVYVKDALQQNVMVVSTDLLSILPKDGTLFRDRALLAYQPYDVVRIDLRSPDRTVRLDLSDTQGWWLKEPVRHPADGKALSELREKLLRATIVDFVPDAKREDERFGLGAPTHSLRFHTRQADVPTVVNLGNAVVSSPGHVYAHLEGLDGVFTVSAGLKVLAETEASALRNRRILPVSASSVEKISIVQGEKSFVLGRAEQGWEISVEGEDAVWPAETSRVERFLQLWVDGQIEQFLSKTGAVEVLPEVYQVDFQLDQDPGELKLNFSVAPSALRKGRASLIPGSGNERWIALPESLNHLPANALAYRSRQVLTFDPEQVVRVARTGQAQTSRVVRATSDELEWETDLPGQQVNDGQVFRVLNRCKDLHAQSLVEQGDANFAEYGLAPPSFRLSFGLGGEQPANRTLLVGQPLPSGEIFGMIQGQDLIFTLSPEQCLDLDVSLTESVPVETLETPHAPETKP